MFRSFLFALLCTPVFAAMPAGAAVLPMQGALRSAAGGPAADGSYVMVTSLYDAEDAKLAVWEELQKKVDVSGGSFAVLLGQGKPIDDAVLLSGKQLWVGVQVGADPELPRQPLYAVPRAYHAAMAATANKAMGLACTGCVTADMIAASAIEAKHVAFAYAGSDSKGGAATEAIYAQTAGLANTAKAADYAALADFATSAKVANLATQADAAKAADSAKVALGLQCSGCVGGGQLDATVLAAYLPLKGGVLTGPLVATQGVDLAGSTLKAANLEAVDVAKATCGATEKGRLWVSQKDGALWYCSGSELQRVKTCTAACKDPTTVSCGVAVTDGCGDIGACAGLGSYCPAGKSCLQGKCASPGETQDLAEASCTSILAKSPASPDGLYWVDPNGGGTADAFQVWCRMGGDYPGAAMAIQRPGNVGGQQNVAGDLNLPCTPSTVGYCKLSDTKINALRAASASIDPYIVLSYKDGGATPFCRSFAKKACQWISNGPAASGCENAVTRNSGQYCNRQQVTSAYRGIDGHTCGNLVYNGVTSPNNPFMIFEHDGGSHYCGGWDTTWNRIEMLVQ